MKQSEKPKIHRAGDMYGWFVKNNPETDITYPLFKETISLFNKLASEYILEGKRVRFGNYLGTVRIQKVERKFSSKPIHVNWGETNKLFKQGIKQRVFFTDDYYFGWHWDKGSCKIKNKTVYKFYPTAGPGGNKKRLARFLNSDDLVKTLYSE